MAKRKLQKKQLIGFAPTVLLHHISPPATLLTDQHPSIWPALNASFLNKFKKIVLKLSTTITFKTSTLFTLRGSQSQKGCL